MNKKKKKKKNKASFLDMAVGCKSASGMRGRSNPEARVGRRAWAHMDAHKPQKPQTGNLTARIWLNV